MEDFVKKGTSLDRNFYHDALQPQLCCLLITNEAYIHRLVFCSFEKPSINLIMRSSIFQKPKLLTFQITVFPMNHDKNSLKLCQTLFSGFVGVFY